MLFPRKYPKIHKEALDKRAFAVYHLKKDGKTVENLTF